MAILPTIALIGINNYTNLGSMLSEIVLKCSLKLYQSYKIVSHKLHFNIGEVKCIVSPGVITTTVKLPASYPSTTYTLNAFLDVTDASHCTAYTVCPLILHVTYINSVSNT